MYSQVKVFLNGEINTNIIATVHGEMTVQQLISDCKEKLNIDQHTKCRMFDSTGGELSDDDMEYINGDEPLFISMGEDFSKSSSLALFEEIKKLGEGGFGSVYLYKHKLSKNDVAIKFVEIESLLSSKDVSRVYSEMGVLRGLKHPNIVQFIDAFTSTDKICFVMEYCGGGELAQYLEEKGALPESEVYSIACQMVEAIRYCHNSKVVHRDLKPENILFLSEAHTQIKIVDFGIAGMFGLNVGERSDAGSLLYIAPEVLSGEDNRANPALDIWSMGCIIYYLLTNTHPFDDQTRESIIKKIQGCRFKKLGQKISKPWHVLINGMLRLVPSQRWSLLRITDHLFKHRYDGEASLTEESDVEVKEPPKAKGKVNYLKVNKKITEETKFSAKKSPSTRNSFQKGNK